MTIEEIRASLTKKEYDFLRTNKHLKNIGLLAVGGSHAYGMNIEGSDLDLRGTALPSVDDILCGNSFEQVRDKRTDTVIYELSKFVHLCSNCNPNVIELLGIKPEHYLVLSDVGDELVKNSDMFLSKKAVYSFGEYASNQLRRLNNKDNRDKTQPMQEQHILNTLSNMSVHFAEIYTPYSEDSIRLYIDDAQNENLDKEIFMDVHLTHYPLRDYKNLWSDMNNVVKDYAKISQRASSAIDRGKLAKHMAHLVRLYYMAFDILEDGKIITYREKEHNLLMQIRNGYFLDGNTVKHEFYEFVDELDANLMRLKTTSPLPNKPDEERIKAFLKQVKYNIIIGEK